MSKAGTSKVKALRLKPIRAVIPADDEEKRQLADDLTKMGCEGLLSMPWTMKSEAMVMELLYDRSNEWDETIRGVPEQWTADRWAEVYCFKKTGRTRAARTDTWINGKFETTISPKDGHAVSDCKDPRERRVLEFVVPILYPEKQGRVTKEVGNTIFGALAGEYLVNWGQIIQEVVMHQVSIVEKRNPSCLSPYLYHLYYRNECLRGDEMEKIEVAIDCLVYGIGDDPAPDTEAESSEKGSARSEERRKASSASPRMTRTVQPPKGRSTGFKDHSVLDLAEEPFARLQYELDQTRHNYEYLEGVVKEVSMLLGDCKVSKISRELTKLKATDPAPVEAANRKLEAANKTLKAEVIDLNAKLALARDSMEELQRKKTDAVLAFLDLAGTPADTLNRAQLFNEFVGKGVPVNLVKMVEILRGFHNKMEAAMVEIRTMVRRSAEVPTQTPSRQQEVTPAKGAQAEVTTTPVSQKDKGVVGEGSMQAPADPVTKLTLDIPAFKSPSVPAAKSPSGVRDFPLLRSPVIPIPAVTEISPLPSQTVPVATPSPAPAVPQDKKKEPTPSPRKLSLRKKKEPTQEVEQLTDTSEDSADSGSSSESTELTTPNRPKKPQTRADRRKTLSAGKNPLPAQFSSPRNPKRNSKTPQKDEEPAKKLRKT